jgi:hypothetical protein
LLAWGALVFRFIVFSATALFFGASFAHAGTVKSVDSKDGKTRLDFVGDIQSGDKAAIESAVKAANDRNRLVVTIRLNSPGGNILEAVGIADLLRRAKMAAAVLSGSTCASACFIILAAGNEKYAHYTAAIGVHGASDSAGQETTESGAATISMARILRELGVPAGIIGKMVVTPPSDMVWLTPDDLHSMGVIMLGKPAQVAEAQPSQQLSEPSKPMTILPDAQASRTPASWSSLVERATAISASQNGGKAKVLRACQPEIKSCVTGLWLSLNGKDMLLKVTSDLTDQIVDREICSFNAYGDVRQCLNWDTGQNHRDMKNANGDWYKVSD